MNRDQTWAMVHAALRDDLQDAPTITDPVFGLHIPQPVPGIPNNIHLPRAAWAAPRRMTLPRRPSPPASAPTPSGSPLVLETIKAAESQRM